MWVFLCKNGTQIQRKSTLRLKNAVSVSLRNNFYSRNDCCCEYWKHIACYCKITDFRKRVNICKNGLKEVRSKISILLETTGGILFSLEEGFQKIPFTIKNFTQGDLHSTGGIQMALLGGYNSTGGIQLSFLGVYNSTGGIQISFP